MAVLPPRSTELPPHTPFDGSAEQTIEGAVTRLLCDRTAGGPSRALTSISPNLVIVTLSDCLTTGERTLVARGHAASVERTRQFLYDTMRAEASEVVEEVTGKAVSAFVTAQAYDPDRAVLIFVLTVSDGTPEAA